MKKPVALNTLTAYAIFCEMLFSGVMTYSEEDEVTIAYFSGKAVCVVRFNEDFVVQHAFTYDAAEVGILNLCIWLNDLLESPALRDEGETDEDVIFYHLTRAITEKYGG